VTWTHEQGGAGITPGHGDWKRVTSSFPPQDALANRQLLKYLTGKTVLKDTDLDKIRALFGEKVGLRNVQITNTNPS
jgi:anoctamin-10